MADEIKKIAYYFHSTPDDTLAYHRVVGPAKHLNMGINFGYKDETIQLDSISSSDIVVIQRDFPRFYEEYNQIIAKARNERKPVILDMDDLLLELPRNHPDRFGHDYKDALLPMFQALLEVDMVTVSSFPLQDYIKKYNPNVRVIPNFLNDDLWKLKPPKNNDDPKNQIIIGYMGGHTHAPDLSLLTPVLLKILKRYPTKVKFVTWGIAPPEELSQLNNVLHIPYKLYRYPQFAAYFQEQKADIFIAPLVDSLFNACKSAVKFLEYTALGAPGIFSNLPPYANAISHGHDGFLASSAEEWLEFLMILIENPDLRYKMALNAQETVRDKWLLSRNTYHWINAYREASHLDKDHIGDPNPLLDTMRSITSQAIEINRMWDQEFTDLSNRVAEQQRFLATTENQLRESKSDNELLIALLHEQEEQLEELAKKAYTQEQLAQELKKELREIYNSKAWRVAILLRKIRLFLFPVGSLRERIFGIPLLLLLFPGKIKRYFRLKENLSLIKNSELFDAQWYLEQNSDVQQVGLDPARHYLLFGGFEGRDPSPHFSSDWYLDNYPEVASSGINPLIHYLKYGKQEKKFPKSPDKN